MASNLEISFYSLILLNITFFTDACRDNQFNCGVNNGGCIKASYRCDGDLDCGDGSDEDGCGK